MVNLLVYSYPGLLTRRLTTSNEATVIIRCLFLQYELRWRHGEQPALSCASCALASSPFLFPCSRAIGAHEDHRCRESPMARFRPISGHTSVSGLSSSDRTTQYSVISHAFNNVRTPRPRCRLTKLVTTIGRSSFVFRMFSARLDAVLPRSGIVRFTFDCSEVWS